MQIKPLLALVLAGPGWPCQDVLMADRDLGRLARVAKARRLQLGLARNKTAVAIGISKDTWARLERGEPIRDINYAKIDAALRWALGSCVAVMEGREPIEVEEGVGGAVLSPVPKADLKEAFKESMARAMIGSTANLTNEQIRDLTAEVLEDLERRGAFQ